MVVVGQDLVQAVIYGAASVRKESVIGSFANAKRAIPVFSAKAGENVTVRKSNRRVKMFKGTGGNAVVKELRK